MSVNFGKMFGEFNPRLDLHPGINYSRTPVGGDIAGLLFVVGSIVVVWAGLPEARMFLAGAGIGGVILGGLLILLHRR